MSLEPTFLSAIPVLASLDIARSVAFFRDHFGFASLFEEQGVYGVVQRDEVSVHFWACTDRRIAENTSCRLRVRGIDALHERCRAAGLVHPKGPLEAKPWGSREFAVLDPDHNLITFTEPLEPS